MMLAASNPLPGGEREHVLLVCPPVFSYHLSIKAELESLGFIVTWWDDRGYDSTLCKIGLRLLPNLLSALLSRTFMRNLAALENLPPVTRVLIVKGEGMSLEVLRSLRATLNQARFSLYFWDSVDNAPRARQIAPLFDAVATFDPVDARELGWGYRPLFARKEALGSRRSARSAALRLVLYRHSAFRPISRRRAAAPVAAGAQAVRVRLRAQRAAHGDSAALRPVAVARIAPIDLHAAHGCGRGRRHLQLVARNSGRGASPSARAHDANSRNADVRQETDHDEPRT